MESLRERGAIRPEPRYDRLMSTGTTAKDDIADRVKLPLSFDVDRMRADVERMGLESFIHYNVMPLRSPAHLVDSSIPRPPPADDYADGSWTEWLDTPALEASPYLSEVVDTFRRNTTVTLVRILRLEPGSPVNEHTDPTLGLHIERSVVRLTIPIQSEPEVVFYLNNQPVPMRPGECWYLRLTDPHRITHDGRLERINMTIDMIPNEWVRSLVQESA